MYLQLRSALSCYGSRRELPSISPFGRLVLGLAEAGLTFRDTTVNTRDPEHFTTEYLVWSSSQEQKNNYGESTIISTIKNATESYPPVLFQVARRNGPSPEARGVHDGPRQAFLGSSSPRALLSRRQPPAPLTRAALTRFQINLPCPRRRRVVSSSLPFLFFSSSSVKLLSSLSAGSLLLDSSAACHTTPDSNPSHSAFVRQQQKKWSSPLEPRDRPSALLRYAFPLIIRALALTEPNAHCCLGHPSACQRPGLCHCHRVRAQERAQGGYPREAGSPEAAQGERR